MPNWCENNLKISGPQDTMKEIKDRLFIKCPELNDRSSEYEFDFNGILPIPADIKASPGAEYYWKCDNWGTKWNASETYTIDLLEHDGSEQDLIDVDFMTAWSPPIPVIEALINAYPDCLITFHYFEAGMFFAGEITPSADGYVNKHYSNVEEKEHILQIADEFFGYAADEFEECNEII